MGDLPGLRMGKSQEAEGLPLALSDLTGYDNSALDIIKFTYLKLAECYQPVRLDALSFAEYCTNITAFDM